MDFQKSIPVISSFNKKNRFSGSQRSLQIESLESREMLAVSILDGPISGYAGLNNTAEIRFEMTTDNGGMSKVDFVVQGYNGLDPAQLTLYNHTTQRTVSLSSVVNGTTSGSASAILGAGSYSLYVAADSGAGTFSLDVLHDDKYAHGDSALEILVAAAIAEQQSGWTNRKDYYNKLLSQYPGFGPNALDGGRVRDLYPQVDVNGDGKVDVLDYQSAQVLASGTITTPSLKTIPSVIYQDKTGPSITASLKNDTGTVGDRITIDTTITGRIADSSGIRSAQYQLDNGSWVSLALDANGNYTIPNQQVVAGSHTITIRATDFIGNETTSSIAFVYPASISPAFPSQSNLVEGGSANIAANNGFIVQKINGTSVQNGNTVSLPGNRGSVTLNSNGSLTFQAGSYYDQLPAGATENYSISVVSTDSHGRQFVSDIVFVIKGKNNPPTLSNSTTIQGPTINEGSSGLVASSTIRSHWKDIDTGTTLNVAANSIFVSGIVYSNTSVRYNANDIANLLTVNANGISLNADANFFKQLGLNESIVITVGYKVSDGVENSAVNGYLTFTVKGVDNASELKTTQKSFADVSNDMKNPVKSFNPGFSVSDADRKDSGGFVYFLSAATDNTGNNVAGLVNVNSTNGSFSVDTSKLANREINSILTLTIGVRSASGGEVFETITIDLNAKSRPSSSNTFTVNETEGKSQKLVPSVAGKNGYTVSGLKLQDGSTLPNGVNLHNVAAIDSQGNFQFVPGTSFEYLANNETKTIVLEYTITDNEYGLTGTGTITLIIEGVSTAPTPPTSSSPVGQGGSINVTEGVDGTAEKTISKDDLLENWLLPEGQEQYDVVNVGTPSFGGWFNGSEKSSVNPFDGSSLGSAAVDANGGIVFTPNSDLYDKLGAGQWIDIAIDYGVKNKDVAGSVDGGQVIVRIYGQNTDPTLDVNEDKFILPNNPAANISNIGAGFTASDADMNNNGTFRYELVGNTQGFVIDSATGNISITKDAAGNLAVGDYTLTVKLSDAHGGFVTKNITVSIFNEPAPEIVSSELEIRVGETDKVDKNLKDFFVNKTDRTYNIGEVSYEGFKGNLPSGFDPASIMIRNGDQFSFDPQKLLELLAANETLTLDFSFTVSIDGFSGCDSVIDFSIVFVGENNAPTWKGGESENIPASKTTTIDWQKYVKDIDRNTVLSIQKINGQEFDSEGKIETSYGVFQYNAETNALTFTPSDAYDGMTEGEEILPFDIEFLVSDEGGLNASGNISFIVTGTNKAPVVKDGQLTMPENNVLEIELDDYVQDANSEDSHQIYEVSVGGKTIQLGGGQNSVELDNGIVITLDETGKKLTVDATNRTEYPTDGMPEHFEIFVKATDNRNENSVSEEPGNWTVVIDTKPPIVVDLDAGTVSEDAIQDLNAIDLNQQVSDANIPKRNENDDWYTISGLQLKEVFFGDESWPLDRFSDWGWKFENGVLSFEDSTGYFDFLAQGETLVFVFSYTVTDNFLKDFDENLLSSEGKLTLTISGVNDDPTISDCDDQYKLSNSERDLGNTIQIGNGFGFVDRDTTDSGHVWSLGEIQGQKGGTSIDKNDLPQFSIDEATGQIWLVNSNLDLLPGESASFVFSIIVTDPNGGTDSKEITVTIYGKQKPIVEIENLGEEGQLILEDGSGTVSTEIKITDPVEDFMDQRTTEDWYAEPTFEVKLSDDADPDFAAYLAEINLNSLFELVKDSDSGRYSLKFIGSKEQFAFLKDGEKLTFDINVFVSDNKFDVTGTAEWTCTITGVGDRHTVTSDNNSVDLWANEINNEPISYDPLYDITDSDKGEGYSYALDESSLPNGFDPNWISLNPETGQITLNRSDFAGFSENTSISFKVIVTGNTDGLVNDVDLTLNIYLAKSPDAENIDITITEDGKVSEPIKVTDPKDGADRADDWYTVDSSASPVLENSSENVSVPDAILDNLTGRIDEDGKFVFDPGNLFEYLSLGEWVELKFEFTVTDIKFGTTSTLTVLVKIEGENSTPDVSDIEKTVGPADESIVELGTVSEWASDKDANDNLTLVSIGGVKVVADTWFAVAGKGEFKYDSESGILYYRSTGSELESIPYNTTQPFEFDIVFKDDSGDELTDTGSGKLKLIVTGTNKRPEIINENTQLPNIAEGDNFEYDASYFANDVNSGDNDKLFFYSINGQQVFDGDVIYLTDGTKITLKNGGKTIVVDTSTRRANMKAGEEDARSFNIVLSDGSGAGNELSATASIRFVIEGRNDPPVMKNQEFVVGISENPGSFIDIGTIDFFDADTPKDAYSFSMKANDALSSFLLDSDNGMLSFWNNKGLLSDLLVNESKSFTFTVFIETEDGESASAEITVTFIRKEAPLVEDVDLTTSESNKTVLRPEMTVTDQTGDGRHTTADSWYTLSNVRFVEGKVVGLNNSAFQTLPYGVIYGIGEDGKFFFDQFASFDGRSAFEFLAAGETLTLTFEVTVKDEQYKVQSTALITITITGENSAPEAKDIEGKVIIRAGSESGIKYYLSDIASDPDTRDSLNITHVNGEEIVLDGAGIDVVENGIVIGTVTLRKDEDKGLYLHFIPSSNYFGIRHDLVKNICFEFTVSDGTESSTGTITQGIRGVNKTPEHLENIDLKTGEKDQLTITAEDLATDPNGDPIRIVAVKVDGTVYEFGYDGTITLPSGATLRFDENGHLVYDPSTRTDNLKRDQSVLETFEICIEDDLDLESSQTAWKEISVTVNGVNDEPVGNLPNGNIIVGKLGDEIRINLGDHFSDPDKDNLHFFLEQDGVVTKLENLSFVQSVEIVNNDGVWQLVILFKPDSEYANNGDFSPIDLTLVIKDGLDADSASITRSVSIQAEPTVKIEVGSSASEVNVGEYYEISVTGKDLLNQLLSGGTLSHGLYNISFAIYFNPDQCEIDEATIRCLFGDFELMDDCIFVTIDGSKIKSGDRFDLALLSFQVKAIASGTSAFQIDSVELTRNDGDQTVHRSQIEKGSIEVRQNAVVPTFNSLLVAFSAPNANVAFSQIAALSGWTAEMESLYGDRNSKNEQIDLIDNLFADEEFLFDSSGKTGDSDDESGVLGDDFENILDELVGIA